MKWKEEKPKEVDSSTKTGEAKVTTGTASNNAENLGSVNQSALDAGSTIVLNTTAADTAADAIESFGFDDISN